MGIPASGSAMVRPVSIAVAIFIIAVGAILRYATNINVEGVDFDTVGLILMIAGAAGLVLSFLYEAFWARRRREEAAAAMERREEPEQPPYPPEQQPYPREQPPPEERREPPRY
jgi:Domain of unknown function (DUF6458)